MIRLIGKTFPSSWSRLQSRKSCGLAGLPTRPEDQYEANGGKW